MISQTIQLGVNIVTPGLAMGHSAPGSWKCQRIDDCDGA
jgi:hypothetical protein